MVGSSTTMAVLGEGGVLGTARMVEVSADVTRLPLAFVLPGTGFLGTENLLGSSTGSVVGGLVMAVFACWACFCALAMAWAHSTNSRGRSVCSRSSQSGWTYFKMLHARSNLMLSGLVSGVCSIASMVMASTGADGPRSSSRVGRLESQNLPRSESRMGAVL